MISTPTSDWMTFSSLRKQKGHRSAVPAVFLAGGRGYRLEERGEVLVFDSGEADAASPCCRSELSLAEAMSEAECVSILI